MSTPTTVGEIVARIEVAHKHFADRLALINDAQLQEARLPEGRSGKDMLAHLTFWDRRLLHAVASHDDPHTSRLIPPLIADIPQGEGWLEAVNERIFQINRERDIATVKEEFAQTCAELRQTVSSLSEHDVFSPDGLSALLGEPFLPMVTGAYEHYEDHEADLQRVAE